MMISNAMKVKMISTSKKNTSTITKIKGYPNYLQPINTLILIQPALNSIEVHSLLIWEDNLLSKLHSKIKRARIILLLKVTAADKIPTLNSVVVM